MIESVDGKPLPAEPRGEHWERFRRERRLRPGLCAVLEAETRERVTRHLSTRADAPINSSWFGKELLEHLPNKHDWDRAFGVHERSSGLSGQMLWTVLAGDDRQWVTTETSKANTGREERVYFLRHGAGSIDRRRRLATDPIAGGSAIHDAGRGLADAAEGIAALLGKRPPCFTGR